MVGFDARTQQGAALRPTSHFVYESIYTAILEKRLAPAAKLSKETLGQIFRVSNGTIQRALTRLAEDGAVVMPPKEVASVARPDERQARQVLDARLLVESEVVRQLPAGLDPAALAELRALVDEEQACLAARDSAGLIRLAGRFHLRLAELTENPLLQGFVRGLVARASLDIALNKGAVYTAEACAAQRLARCPGGRRQRGGGCADGRLPARPVRPHALPAATYHRPARGIRHEGPSWGKTPEGLTSPAAAYQIWQAVVAGGQPIVKRVRDGAVLVEVAKGPL